MLCLFFAFVVSQAYEESGNVDEDPFSVLKPNFELEQGTPRRVRGRSVSDLLQTNISRKVLVSEDDISKSSIEETMLFKFIKVMHGCIPKSSLLQVVQNLRSYIEQRDMFGSIPCGCACSGTGIWSRANEALAQFWEQEFGLPRVTFNHRFMCEIDDEKRAWLHMQHSPPALFTDISKMAGNKKEAHRAFCAVTGQEIFPPWVAEYGAGFVCKDFTR